MSGTEFRRKTLGMTIDSTVLEFVRHERLVRLGALAMPGRMSRRHER